MSRPGMHPRGAVLAAGLVGLAFLLVPDAASAGESLDGIVRTYQEHGGIWLARVAPIARDLFAILAALEFSVTGLVWLLSGEAADVILRGVVKKFLLLGLFYTLIAFFPAFVPVITHGFERAGQHASGELAVSPSAVIDQGIYVTAVLFDNVSTAGFLTHPAGTLLYPLVALLVLLAYVSIAAQLVLALVESYFVVTSGMLFLGFSGFRATAPLADNFLLYSFQVGTKIFLLYMLVAVGADFTEEWTRNLLDIQPFTGETLRPAFEVLGGSLIYAYLVWRIPGHVASFLTQNAQFRLRDALAS